jgi:hypothetical protein
LAKQYDQHLRHIHSGDEFDPNFRRLRYTRYADDFLIGFMGPKDEAKEIKEEVRQFLESIHLKLSEEKTHITHARTERARFLGYDITTSWNHTQITKYQDGSASRKRRAVNGRIQLFVPREVVTKWTQRYGKQGKPAHISPYIELSDYEIVLTFGAQLRGIVNYYALATNVGKAIGKVRWYGMESCRKTLAAKHKMRSTKATYRKYYHRTETNKGNKRKDEWSHLRVVVERENKPSLVAKCGETPVITRKVTYNVSDEIPPFAIAGVKSELLTTLLAGECQLCGRKDNLEAHHIRKLKDLKKRWQGRKDKPAWVKSMIARRRKTVVVCHACHTKITYGRYDGDKFT